ncbi:hypothetical protein J6590_082156 [Homalodisca vitripennis]|nr:hypothetical protein J6590_082156 [Homalodisca vitripennis]
MNLPVLGSELLASFVSKSQGQLMPGGMARLRRGESSTEDRERWRQLVGEAKYHLGYPWPWE